jgi:diaminopimelate epimerase
VQFTKYHGLGNDYLVVEPAALGGAEITSIAARLCHRNYGVGGDGILLGPLPSSTALAALRIINPDGSEAEKSGNGLRIFARYLWDTQRVESAPFQIETKGGVVTAQVLSERGLIRVSMGHARFVSSTELGLTGSPREVVDEVLDFEGAPLACSAIDIGNPHCVIRGVPVTEQEARRLGSAVERASYFKNRTNVQLLSIIDRANIEIQIWERGAGYTLASGSSASAAACAARRLGLCDEQISVHMPGGILSVEISADYAVTQTGPASKVAEGVADPEIFETDRAPFVRA